MFLSRHKNGVYYLFYSVGGNRRRISTHSRNKSDAVQFIRAFKENERPKKTNITLKQFREGILQYAKINHRKGTVTIYRTCIDNFISFIGDVRINSITRDMVRNYRSFRLSNVRSATVRIDLSTLRAGFNVAVNVWQMISENPFVGVKLPQYRESEPIFFPRIAFNAFLSSIKEEWFRNLVEFGALTGLRRGELINLEWRAVDIDRKLLTVKLSDTFHTKTDKERIVTLCKRACEILRETKHVDRYVFTLNGKQIYGPWASHLLKRYIRASKLGNDDLHFHSLRHSFASWLIQGGESIYAVKELLGHTDIKTTQIYTHLQRSHLHDAVKVLDK